MFPVDIIFISIRDPDNIRWEAFRHEGFKENKGGASKKMDYNV